MLSYLNAEASFIRAYGNRSLLLIFLCALTRTASSGKVSALGLSLDMSPALIVVCGPPLALLIVISLKMEADNLYVARNATLEEFSRLPQRGLNPSRWTYVLFVIPPLAALFLTIQFLFNVVPAEPGCQNWNWLRQLTDLSFQGGHPSTLCLRDQQGPWIYPPLQSYLYIGCVLASAHLAWEVIKKWPTMRAIQ
ncbi:hypothetical protein ACU8MW_08105 [Rhizobium leguminosarum]